MNRLYDSSDWEVGREIRSNMRAEARAKKGL